MQIPKLSFILAFFTCFNLISGIGVAYKTDGDTNSIELIEREGSEMAVIQYSGSLGGISSFLNDAFETLYKSGTIPAGSAILTDVENMEQTRDSIKARIQIPVENAPAKPIEGFTFKRETKQSLARMHNVDLLNPGNDMQRLLSWIEKKGLSSASKVQYRLLSVSTKHISLEIPILANHSDN